MGLGSGCGADQEGTLATVVQAPVGQGKQTTLTWLTTDDQRLGASIDF